MPTLSVISEIKAFTRVYLRWVLDNNNSDALQISLETTGISVLGSSNKTTLDSSACVIAQQSVHCLQLLGQSMLSG